MLLTMQTYFQLSDGRITAVARRGKCGHIAYATLRGTTAYTWLRWPAAKAFTFAMAYAAKRRLERLIKRGAK